MPVRVLFLTLKIFSLTGGIEKMCRTVCRCLFDISEEGKISTMTHCLYDYKAQRDSRYLPRYQFLTFGGNRYWFIIKSVIAGLRSDVVILSHINLAVIAEVIKLISPRKKIILFAHGIEIWRKLPDWKFRVLQKMDRIVAVSTFTRNVIINKSGIDPDRITVLNNALDPFYYFPEEFSKPMNLLRRYGLREDQPVLFTLTRLASSEKYKGYDNIIEIMPEVVKSYPGCIYLIGGSGDEREKKRIGDLIVKKGMEKHIKLLGFVDEAEIADHFLLADLFVMPSKKEGFGIVFIESLACGLPVIAGNKDGSTDALRNGELGTLVDPDDPGEIQNAIISGLGKPRSGQNRKLLQDQCRTSFGYAQYRRQLSEILVDR